MIWSLATMASNGEPPESTSLFDEILRGLPRRVEAWIRGLRLRSIIIALVLFLAGAIVSGIVEGESFKFWDTSIQPWFGETYPNWLVTNRLLLFIWCGWLLTLLAIIGVFLIYAANRRRLGELEAVRRELDGPRSELVGIAHQLEGLAPESGTLKEQVDTIILELKRRWKESNLLHLLRNADRELFLLFTEGGVGARDEEIFVTGFLRRTCEMFGDHQIRASVYTPDTTDPERLSIKWDLGVGQVARWRNRWYIGELDPPPRDKPRGIPGAVWMKNESRVNADVTKDPDFAEAYDPPREHRPYVSTLHALIYPDDTQRKLGILALDSDSYEFTAHDLELMTLAATRLGWFMRAQEIRQENQ
jgi:hypothetical protein